MSCSFFPAFIVSLPFLHGFSLSKNCNRKCQQDILGVFSISSFAWGWEAGKLHCSHINNTQARYMMYEEISPGLRNCFLPVLD